MRERNPTSSGPQIDDARGDPRAPKLGAAWVQPGSAGMATSLQTFGGGLLGQPMGQGLVGATPGQAEAAPWQATGMSGVQPGHLGGGGWQADRFGAADTPPPAQIGTLPSPVTVGVSPEYLGLVTAAGTTVAAMGTVYTSVLATFKDRRERQANAREQDKHALAMKKLELEIAQASEALATNKRVGTGHAPVGKKKP